MSIFETLKPYLLDTPRPLIGAETIQLILIREIHDFTVLRTEESRELNTVHTPLSIKDKTSTRRVAFLASKQKAAETRELEHILRTATNAAGIKVEECYLKDNLCLTCPRCALFGATSTESGRADKSNIKHRIEYSTAFSLLPFEDISSAITFNAIDDKTTTTGQALGTRFSVSPATIFPSIITLKSITKEELILAIKFLLSCKSYGAESRIGGDIRNTIMAVVAGWEEIITSLELTLELYDRKDNISFEVIHDILETSYLPLAGNKNKVMILGKEEVGSLLSECINIDIDKQFLDKAYSQVKEYKKIQSNNK